MEERPRIPEGGVPKGEMPPVKHIIILSAIAIAVLVYAGVHYNII